MNRGRKIPPQNDHGESIKKPKYLYMCFRNLEKTFVTLKHKLLVDALRRFGVDGKDMRIYTRNYLEQKEAVRVSDETSEWIEINHGVR